MNKVGVEGEQIAAEYLESHKYEVVERNFRAKTGEIDLIAKKDGYYVFVEVKSRLSARFGAPMQAVTREKQWRIVRTAEYYLMARRIRDVDIRFDVIEVFCDRVNHVENAFWAN